MYGVLYTHKNSSVEASGPLSRFSHFCLCTPVALSTFLCCLFLTRAVITAIFASLLVYSIESSTQYMVLFVKCLPPPPPPPQD